MTVTAVYVSVSTRLPEPLATHFGVSGRADGYSSTHGFLTGCLGVLLVLGTAFGLAAQARRFADAAPWLVVTGYATAAGIGYPLCLTLLHNADVTDAATVRLPLWQVAVTLAVALLAGAVGWLLAGRSARSPQRAAGDAPRLDLPAGTTAGWSRTIGSRPLNVLGALMLCAGVVVVVRADALTGAFLLASASVVLGLTSVRVTVDRRGLTLAPLLILPASRIRFRRIPLERVVEATSRPINCLADLGGWGYRILPGRSGLALRSGDGIVIRLTNGREFMVTVDDAATAAALLNTYADRARSQQGG
ncbi:DUF1648 domain-containing protein [Streptomyces sp. NPDC048506]|uniref:DUF1648 domain-containing protein n=1 Tax=Streptomyces sp. NPDC048506 TaxID=3155028 RepID=UPI00343B807F